MKNATPMKAIAVAVSTAIFGATAVGAVTIFTDRGVRVEAYGNPLYSGVGVVMTAVAQDGSPKACSFAVIHQRWLLSAAHCFQEFPGKLAYFEVNHGENYELVIEVLDTYSVAGFHMKNRVFNDDWALVKLKTQIPAQFPSYTFATPRHLKVGQAAILIGYPKDRAGVRMVSSNCKITGLSDDQILTDCPMMGGNSGGPLLIRGDNDEWLLAGIMSTQYIDKQQKTVSGVKYSDKMANYAVNVTLKTESIIAAINQNSGK